jgi:transcriptional regulator with XRE-family HTH domain
MNKTENNLRSLIRKIEGKTGLEILEDFKQKCARELGISRTSVNRYMANTSQPNFHRLQQILLILKRYDNSITGADLIKEPKTLKLKNPLQ